VAELKTKPNPASVAAFLDGIADEQRRRECKALARMMKQATGAAPKMWGSSIVGFGSYHYKYDSGREGDWFLAGFSPRKRELTVYIVAGVDCSPDLLRRLGKFTTGKSCLYMNRLDDIDMNVLEKLVRQSVKDIGRRVESAGAAGAGRKRRKK
jgi:hypothetical protein